MASKFLVLVVLLSTLICTTTASRILVGTKGSVSHQVTSFRRLEIGGGLAGGARADFGGAPGAVGGGLGGSCEFEGGAGGDFEVVSGLGDGAAAGRVGFGCGGAGGGVGYGGGGVSP